jgi:hypothetical protein
VYICFISELSPQDAFQIESELFVRYYSERKKKEVSTDATYSTIPQFYFKVRYDSSCFWHCCPYSRRLTSTVLTLGVVANVEVSLLDGCDNQSLYSG